jgi:hypothetical protein
MKLKIDKDGNVVTKEVDGEVMPIYEHNGKDEPHNAATAVETIKSQANQIEDLEKSSDKQTKDLTKKLKAWERLGELPEVRKKVQAADALKDSDLDPESATQEIASLKAENETLTEQLNEASEAAKAKDGEIWDLAIGNEIGASKFVRDELIDAFAKNPKMIKKLFGGHFKFEEGEVRAYGPDGKPILYVDPDTNKARSATVDEALNVLIGPDFRKPSGAEGSDAPTETLRTPSTASTVMSKADLRSPEDKAAYIDKHGLDSFQALPPGKRDDVATI